MSHEDPYNDLSAFEAKYADCNGVNADPEASVSDDNFAHELEALSVSPGHVPELGKTPSASETAPGTFLDHRIEDALKLGENLAADLVRSVKALPSEDVQSDLLDNALTLSSRPPPVTRIIGVVGESGHGKSSLINSLLDTKGLAMTGASGSAVTSFVVEYRMAQDTQSLPYLLSFTRLTTPELHEEMEHLLEDFHYGQLAQLKELEGDGKMISEAHHDDLTKKSETAKTVFETAFTALPEFSLTQLEYTNVVEKEECLRIIMGWTERLTWPCSDGNITWTEAAETPSRLNELVQSLCDQGFWPLLKQICVRLRSPMLKYGIVLADIPGYHDVNLARERAAKRYERMCDDLIVVADIRRAVTSGTIADVIRGFRITPLELGIACSKNVVVVCTHAGSVADDEGLAKLVDSSAIKKAKIKLDTAMNNDAPWTTVKAAEHEYNMLLMKARNKKVVLDLQKKYHSSFSPASLPVFCVDNLIYFNQKFSLDREASGIPDLQRRVIELPMQRLLQDALHYLTASIPGLLSRYELCVVTMRSRLQTANGSTTELPDRPLPKVDLLGDCILAIEEWKAAVIEVVRVNIDLPLKCSEEAIVREALDTVDSWRAMHSSSVWAWFRRQGCHSTKAVPNKNWNAELVASFSIEEHLHNFNCQCNAEVARVQENIGSIFVALSTKLSGAQSEDHHPNALVTAVNAYIRTVKYISLQLMKNFCHGLGDIEHDGSTGEPTSYMVAFMLPTYIQGANDYGKDVTKRRMALLNDRVGQGSFVDAHRRRLKAEIQALLDRTEASIQTQIDPIIKAIGTDLELVQTKSSRQRRTSSSPDTSKIDLAVLATNEQVLKEGATLIARIEALLQAAGSVPVQNGANGHAH